ncbi:MAG: TRAP transporter substrate-binding protein [Candidatus Thiodiazotropha sp. (ex. Lucinisca nassula)]|nr:TRAP transporter substrate-binding protein [Candidatus Thiodiazotropha sp. (ex. Lucinisca nassula)]
MNVRSYSSLAFILAIVVVLFNGDLKADPIKVICSTDNPQNSLHVFALNKFAELLDDYSSGELQAVVHYRGNPQYPAIRGEEVNVNMLMSTSTRALNELHVSVMAVGNAAQKVETLGFLMLPYLFNDMESAKRLFGSDFMMQTLNEKIATRYRVRALGWLMGGFRHMTNSVRPVTKLDDLEGLKIRLPASRIMVSTYKALGADVRPISWSQVPDALKRGDIDGQENPYNVIVYSKFWEANQKYVTNNGPFLWTGPILVSETFFLSLSDTQQAAMMRAGSEAASLEWQWIASQNQKMLQSLIDHGMQVNELEDKADWVSRTRPVWEQQYELIGGGDPADGKELVDRVLKQIH